MLYFIFDTAIIQLDTVLSCCFSRKSIFPRYRFVILCKFKKQVLDKNADDDPDGLRLVSLSKDDVVEMIRDCYLAIAKNYKQKLEWAKDADLCMFFLQPRIESSIRDWETGAEKCVKLNADGKMDVPYPLDDTFEYEIMVLIETINNYDWECIDVVLYGY